MMKSAVFFSNISIESKLYKFKNISHLASVLSLYIDGPCDLWCGSGSGLIRLFWVTRIGILNSQIHKLYNTKCLLFAVYGPSDRMLVPRTYQRTTDDAQFVLSLGTKVNNNKGRVSIVFTSLSFLHSLGEGITDSKVAPVFWSAPTGDRMRHQQQSFVLGWYQNCAEYVHYAA